MFDVKPATPVTVVGGRRWQAEAQLGVSVLSAGAVPLTVIERAFVAVLAVGMVASVTVTVKFEVAAAVGAPEITPAELSVNPAGRAPTVTAHVWGVVPPAATRVTGPYADPTVPAASGEVVLILKGVPAAATIIEKACVAVLAVGMVASVTVTVKFEVPAAVGVPEITPAEVSVNPAGSVPVVTAHDKGNVPLLAARVWL
jgi:hypothetical protein